MQADVSRVSSFGVPRFLLRNRLLMACIAIQSLAAFGVSVFLGIPLELQTFNMLLMVCFQLVPVSLTLLVIVHFLYLAIWVRPKRPTQRMIADAKRLFLDRERMATGAVALLCFVFFIGAFTFLKGAIPLLVPFSWDVTFAEWDRALHFGIDPYRIVLGLLGTSFMVSAINIAYHWWFFLMYFLLVFACFAKADRKAGYTFLVSTVLVWFVGGNVLATVFSSAGPVYFERLGLGTEFVALTDALKGFDQQSAVWALGVHELLWEGYVADGRISGISAMPSMHVASTTLMTFYAFSFGRWAGRAMLGFLAIIVIGSVLLAWHYAIDAYLGMALAYLGWKLSGWLVRKDGMA
jgi:hypothetical protein